VVIDIALCPQGNLAIRLQETSAPEFIHIIFQTLNYVSGEGQGGKEGQAKSRKTRRAGCVLCSRVFAQHTQDLGFHPQHGRRKKRWWRAEEEARGGSRGSQGQMETVEPAPTHPPP
jgi:hypothetical protein